MAGFELTESLAGRLRLAKGGEERPIAVTIHGKSSSITTFVRRRALSIEGVIDAPGFADHRPLEGAIDASDLFAHRRLAYAFRFVADDGATYAFAGEKTFVPRNFVVSFTLLAGTIRSVDRDSDLALDPVGDVLLRFDLRGDLLHLAQSLRFTR